MKMNIIWISLLLFFSCTESNSSKSEETPSSSPFSFVNKVHKSEDNSERKDYALFFAVNNYENDEITDLNNPIRDAKCIAAELESKYGFEVELHYNPTLGTIEKVIQKWKNDRKFNKNDQLFVFFSGHGTIDNDLGYFIPHNGHLNSIPTFYSLVRMGSSIFEIPCNNILLAIDACYSGNIHELSNRNIPKYDDILDSIRQRNVIFQQLEHKSRLIITSGDKNVKTPDGDVHSPFSKAILDALRQEYVHRDRLLIYQELLAYLAQTHVVPRPHEGKWHFGSNKDEGGGFVFLAKENRNTNSTIQCDSDILETEYEDELPPTGVSKVDDIKKIDNLPLSKKIMKTIKETGFTPSSIQMADGQFWMNKNVDLDLDQSGHSFHHTVNKHYIKLFGRLYNWETADEICKSLGPGWQLPSRDDWKKLINAYGGVGKTSYEALIKNGNSDFNATFAGRRPSKGTILSTNSIGIYWTSDRENEKINVVQFDNNPNFQGLSWSTYPPDYALSCRCIKK